MKKYTKPFTLVALTDLSKYLDNPGLHDSEGTNQLSKPASDSSEIEEDDDLGW